MKPKNELIIMCKNEEIKKVFQSYSTLHPDEPVLFDGIITEGDHNILFILKESNIGENIKKSDIDYAFWFKEVYKTKKANPCDYYGKNLTRVEKSAQTKYFNCITQIVEGIRETEANIDTDTKIGISYININKNGGGSNCNSIGIKDWLKTDCKHQFLLDQIKTIKPDKIVIFSCNNSNPQIQEFAKELNSKYSVIEKEYHPSRYKKSKNKN